MIYSCPVDSIDEVEAGVTPPKIGTVMLFDTSKSEPGTDIEKLHRPWFVSQHKASTEEWGYPTNNIYNHIRINIALRYNNEFTYVNSDYSTFGPESGNVHYQVSGKCTKISD